MINLGAINPGFRLCAQGMRQKAIAVHSFFLLLASIFWLSKAKLKLCQSSESLRGSVLLACRNHVTT